MTVRTITTIIILAFSTSAFATKPEPKPEVTTLEQNQHQHQGQHQGQAQGQGQAQNSENTVDVEANGGHSTAFGGHGVGIGGDSNAGANSSNSSDISITGDTYDLPSNASFAPPAFSNIECGSVLGFAFTNTNGSGSLGLPVPRWLSKKIQDCEAEADGNWLAEMGLRYAAIEARCATRSMRARFGNKMKGARNQTTACVTHLAGTVLNDKKLAELQNAILSLQESNKQLREELTTTRTAAEIDLENCQEGTERATEAWKGCLAK